ncbi:PrgH/EprH family type III secretion apparatus protein [Pararobbsia alpina]|nr:PrgH/EprH family type III secretion apparatus protein [Pararobbsia alpina]
MANRLVPADARDTYVLRILFGPLCGLELPLDAGRYFFVTANAGDDTQALGESVLKDVDQTFWVPGGFAVPNDGSPSSSEWQTIIPNFAIEFAERSRIDVFGPAGLRSQELGAGHVFESDGIRLAFRRGDQPWPDTLTDAAGDDGPAHSVSLQSEPASKSSAARQDSTPGVPRGTQGAAAGSASTDTDPDARHLPFPENPASHAARPGRRSPKASRQKWRIVATISALAGFAAAGLHASSLVGPARTNILTSTLTEQLRGSPNPPVVRHGRDNRVYVLVATPRDAAWALQALHKAGGDDQVRVRVEAQEIERLESVLKQRSVQFFKLRFDPPARPTLLLNGDDHPENSRWTDTLRQAMLAAIPYADDLKIERCPLAFIDDKARAGLDAMQIPYRSVRQGSGTTYQITRALDDAELSALDLFARSFAHDWGTRQIRFKFQAGDDVPPGKSYRYGSSNYVSAGGDSVHFVKPVL